jgi:outer membrane biosynthesis protein TonB
MPKDKNGILGTIIFHNILFLILFFFGFIEPKEPEGIESIVINFGDEEYGRGTSEPAEVMETAEIPEQSVPSVEEISVDDSKDEIMTQDYEKAPPVQKKKSEKKQDASKAEDKIVEKEKEPVEKPKEVNKRALYSGKNKSSDSDDSEGIKDAGGNQGRPDGSQDSESYSLGLGEGVSFNLEGRGFVSLPKPELNYQKQGIVKVEITVDRQGNVVNVNPGVKGSTTLDTYLLNIARSAALKSKFTSKPDAPFHQKGYIIYHFKLQSDNL